MTLKKIDEMVSRVNTLTEEEKEKLAKGILKNKKARGIAISGAIAENNMKLASILLFAKK